jgi:hypothetical protein
LVGIVQDTSKQIVDLFYDMKRPKPQEGDPEEDEPEETPFITGHYQEGKSGQYEG